MRDTEAPAETSSAEQLAALQEQRTRLLADLEQEQAAVSAAEVALAEQQRLYDEAGRVLADARRAYLGDGGYQTISPEQWRRDTGQGQAQQAAAEATYRQAEAAFRQAEDELRPALVAFNAAGQRLSGLRGRLRALDAAIDQAEAEAAAVQQAPQRDTRTWLAELRDRLTGAAA